ncbi:MAG: nucleoside triphosphate pyrophosphohydrolase family protein [Endomicrobia bacterium]|nr:nucleoside triphosphate pyrophosphohydrolase family protein [Endomicrobiia bacterium]
MNEIYNYALEAKKTAIYPNMGKNLTYVTLGLIGEVGEVCNIVKKIQRDYGSINDEIKHKLKDELGDVLWYLVMYAFEKNINLEEIQIKKKIRTNHSIYDTSIKLFYFVSKIINNKDNRKIIKLIENSISSMQKICKIIDLSLNDVMLYNINKLQMRYAEKLTQKGRDFGI